MKTLGMKQKQLSELTGIPRSRISEYATGRREPSLENYTKIQKVLNSASTDEVSAPESLTQQYFVAAVNFLMGKYSLTENKLSKMTKLPRKEILAARSVTPENKDAQAKIANALGCSLSEFLSIGRNRMTGDRYPLEEEYSPWLAEYLPRIESLPAEARQRFEAMVIGFLAANVA